MSSLLATPVSDWGTACATRITNANISTGFVDEYGNLMPLFNNFTWGVDKDTCDLYCGKDKIYQVFDFNVFANAFTSWLLPWVALTAQLPFEAKRPVVNLMILSMAVGSPALITYSLTLTILNRIWIRRRFESLKKTLKELPEGLRHRIGERLQAVQYILQESQQVPMRASQVDGWLSNLIALDDNHTWLVGTNKDLRNTRRGYTFSLVAQIGMAFLAYTLTIAISLNSSPLGNTEGSGVLLTASGGIWIWMIPVILGWIMCGVQARACSITDALEDPSHPIFRCSAEGNILKAISNMAFVLALDLFLGHVLLNFGPPLRDTVAPSAEAENESVYKMELASHIEAPDEGEAGNEKYEVEEASALGMAGDDITLLDLKKAKSFRSPIGGFDFDYEKLRLPSWLGFSIEGDEALEGPIFNSARLFTSREFGSTVISAFNKYLQSLKVGNTGQTKNVVEFAALCGLEEVPLEAYTQWQNIDSNVWHHMFIAAFAAIFVQWGTTGPAIMIAYLTPTVGLGCRSGGYLIYGVLGTISWILNLCSSILSHAASLKYQDIYMGRSDYHPWRKNSDTEDAGGESRQMLPTVRFNENSDPANLSAHRRTRSHSILAALTVITRITGKSIAIANACWIVISTIFEYTGVYSNCWCASNADVLGSRAWAVLFASDQSFQTVARNYWVGV